MKVASYRPSEHDVCYLKKDLVFILHYSPYPSNWYSCKRIRKDGTLGKEFHGYGGQLSFSPYEGSFSIIIKLK